MSIHLLTRYGLTRGAGDIPVAPSTGILSIAAFGNNSSTASQHGYRFTVGASPLEVSALRIITATEVPFDLRLFRVRGQQLITKVTVDGVIDEWAEGAITPIILNSGEDYIVTLRGGTTSRSHKRVLDNDVGNIAFDPGITYVGWLSQSSDAYPTSTTTSLLGVPDIAFTPTANTDPSDYLLLANPSLTGLTSGSQVGWEFTTAQALTVTALRCLLAAGAEETLRLWRISDETLLASATVTPEVNSDWTMAPLGAPVGLAADTAYAVTTRRTDGSTRSWRYGAATGFSINTAFATFVRPRSVRADTFPGAQSGTSLYGLADIVFTIP